MLRRVTSTIAVSGSGTFADALVGALRARAVAAVAVGAAGATSGREGGDVGAWVHVCGGDALTAHAITEADAASWHLGCEAVLWQSVAALQAAHRTLSERGGSVVVITSTVGVSGAPHAAPLAAALEGTRAMAKSAARQWGKLGITVNCVAVPLDALVSSHAGLTTFLPPAAIVRDDLVGDVAATVEFLAGPGAAGITGTTVTVDGGAVMAW